MSLCRKSEKPILYKLKEQNSYIRGTWAFFSCAYVPQNNEQEMFFILYTKQEMKITINWTEKEVEFKSVYTHKVDRWFNEILYKDSKWWELNYANYQLANDYAIEQMTNLSKDEIDELSVDEYNKILEQIVKIKIPSKK